MGNQILFFGNVFAHLVVLMSGIVSFIFATVAAIRKRPLIERWFWVAGAICLIAAFDSAWQDEHRNTQTVIAEKSVLASAENSCQQNALIADAYKRGLESANLTERQTIDKQQIAVNSCVVSLGKMNPIVNTRTPVVSFIVAFSTPKDRFGLPQKLNWYGIVIMTNRKLEPVGKLSCDKPFTVGDAQLHIQASSAMIGPPTIKKISDTAFDIRISNTGADWEDGNPITVSASSVSESLNCSFNTDE